MENIDKKDKYYIQRTRGLDFPRFMVGLIFSHRY